jgi:diadenosine tetraphosphate (Ap4A) HIT family hydrolase
VIALDRVDCLACELIEHPERIPGGRIATIGHWVVEHCIGPLGVGTVVVKPIRHVIHLADLDSGEIADLGPVLARVARAVTFASSDAGDPPGQVYACLWSHAQREPGHIHFVLQPVGDRVMAQHDAYGPELQVRMFRAEEKMDSALMIRAAERIRVLLDDGRPKVPRSDTVSEGGRRDRRPASTSIARNRARRKR